MAKTDVQVLLSRDIIHLYLHSYFVNSYFCSTFLKVLQAHVVVLRGRESKKKVNKIQVIFWYNIIRRRTILSFFAFYPLSPYYILHCWNKSLIFSFTFGRYLELPGVLQLHRHASFTRKLLRLSRERAWTRRGCTNVVRRVSIYYPLWIF